MEIVENYRHFCGYPGKRKRNRAGGYRLRSLSGLQPLLSNSNES